MNAAAATDADLLAEARAPFECDAYRREVTGEECAARWREANRRWTEPLRLWWCRSCPAGEDRAAALPRADGPPAALVVVTEPKTTEREGEGVARKEEASSSAETVEPADGCDRCGRPKVYAERNKPRGEAEEPFCGKCIDVGRQAMSRKGRARTPENVAEYLRVTLPVMRGAASAPATVEPPPAADAQALAPHANLLDEWRAGEDLDAARLEPDNDAPLTDAHVLVLAAERVAAIDRILVGLDLRRAHVAAERSAALAEVDVITSRMRGAP